MSENGPITCEALTQQNRGETQTIQKGDYHLYKLDNEIVLIRCYPPDGSHTWNVFFHDGIIAESRFEFHDKNYRHLIRTYPKEPAKQK